MADTSSIHEGDRLPVYKGMLQVNGAAADLTEAALLFRLRQDGASANEALTALVSIVGAATDRVVEYNYGSRDTSKATSAEVELYHAEVEATYAGGITII